MRVNSSFLSSNMKFRHQQQQQEENGSRNSHRMCSVRKGVLRKSRARVSFLIKLHAQDCDFIKKGTLVQMFSCEFCKISKNTFFTEHLRATASAGGGIQLQLIRMITPMKKKKIVLWPIVFWCFSKLKIISARRENSKSPSNANSLVSSGFHPHPKVITRLSQKLPFHTYFFLTSRQQQNIRNSSP